MTRRKASAHVFIFVFIIGNIHGSTIYNPPVTLVFSWEPLHANAHVLQGFSRNSQPSHSKGPFHEW